MIVTHRLHTSCLLLLAAGLFAGCNKDDAVVRTYQAPKDVSPPQVAMGGSQPPVVEAPSQGATQPIQWKLPAGWKQLPGGGEMRYATIAVSEADPKAELTVVPLPAAAAPVGPNVSRWAAQLKLPPVSDADLPKFVHQTQVSGEQAQIIDMTGSAETGNPPTHLLAAIIPHGDQAWFFTLKAPDPIVTAQKANFETFIHSIQFSEAGPATADANAGPHSMADLPNPHGGASGDMLNPHGGGMAPDQSNPHGGEMPQVSFKLVKWTTPDRWTEQPGSNSMRVTSFRVGPADQQAEVVVARIAQNNTGSFVDNVNRWRGQVGLDPIQQQQPGAMQPITMGGQPALLFDATGPAKRITVAMGMEGADFWFIKLIGPTPVVTKQQDAFKQFLASLQFAPESH